MLHRYEQVLGRRITTRRQFERASEIDLRRSLKLFITSDVAVVSVPLSSVQLHFAFGL